MDLSFSACAGDYELFRPCMGREKREMLRESGFRLLEYSGVGAIGRGLCDDCVGFTKSVLPSKGNYDKIQLGRPNVLLCFSKGHGDSLSRRAGRRGAHEAQETIYEHI